VLKKAFILSIAATALFANSSKIQSSEFDIYQNPKDRQAIIDPIYNHQAKILTRNTWDFSLAGSFIYWKSKLDGLDIAYKPASPSIGNEGHMAYFNFGYEPGYQISLGAFPSYDNWELFFNFTRFTSTRHKSVTAWSDTYIYPSWITLDQNIVSADGTWDFLMNMIDASVLRSAYVGTKLTCKPTFGIRFARFKHRLKVAYLSYEQSESKAWEDTFVLGPRIGANTSYLFPYNFRFFTNAFGSIAYQYFKSKFKEQNIILPCSLCSHVKDRTGVICPNMDLNMGIGWSAYVDDHGFNIDLKASYDYHLFFDQNRMRALKDSLVDLSDGSKGNLYLQGLSLSLSILF